MSAIIDFIEIMRGHIKSLILVGIFAGPTLLNAQNDNNSIKFDGARSINFIKVDKNLQRNTQANITKYQDFFPTQSLSVDLWLNPSELCSSPALGCGIVQCGAANTLTPVDWGGAAGYTLTYKDGKVYFVLGFADGSDSYWANESGEVHADVSINQWSHVVATYNGSTMAIYVNGVKQSSKSVQGSIIYADTEESYIHKNTQAKSAYTYLKVGHGELPEASYFKGSMDNVRLWKKTLQENEIKEFYKKKQIIGIEEDLLMNLTGYQINGKWDAGWRQIEGSWYTSSSTSTTPIIENSGIVLDPITCNSTTEQAPEVETSSEKCSAITLRWSASDLNSTNSDWSRLPESSKRWYIERYPLSDSRNPAVCESPLTSINPLSLGNTSDKFLTSWTTTELTDTNLTPVQSVDNNKYVYYVYAYNIIGKTFSKPYIVKGEVFYPPNPINIKATAYSSKLEVTWDTPGWWKDGAALQTNIPGLKFVLNAISPTQLSVGNTSDQELVDDKSNFAANKGGNVQYELFAQYQGCEQPTDKIHRTTFTYRVPLDVATAPTNVATETHVVSGKSTQFLVWDQASQLIDITEFQIYQGEDQVGTVAAVANQSHYRYDLNLSTDCGEFDYKVYAKGMWNRVGSDVLKVVVAPTIAMSAVKASKGAYEDRVNVEWEEVSNAAGYRIYRNEEQLSTLYDKKRTLYADRDILPGEIYAYRVEAFLKCETAPTSSQSDEGFTLANGTISGLVKSPNGQAIKDVEVKVSPIVNGSLFTSASNGNAKVENLVLSMNDDWTMEGWVKTSKSTGALFGMVGANKVHTIYRSGSNIIFRETQGSTTTDIVSAVDPTKDGEWLHVACTYANRQMKLYLNGEYKQSALLTGNNGMLNHILINVSVWYGISNSYYDEFRVWSKRLSDEEIKRNYKRTLSGSEDGLKLYLRFDEGSMETSMTNKTYNLAKATIDDDIRVIFYAGTQLVDFGSNQLFTSGYTDDKGIFRIKNINYGGSLGKSFSVIPSKGDDVFEPLEQSITLDPNRTIVDQVDFEDQSLRTVSGTVSYRKLQRKDHDPPLPYYYSNNPEVCYVENAEILVDGESTLPATFTNSDGFYKMDVTQGSHHISVKPTQHIIQIPPAKDYLHLTNNASTYVSVHDDGLYQSSSFTWEVWFKLDNGLLGDNRFLLKSPKALAEIENYNGKNRLRVFLGDSKTDLLGNKILETDKWYHLAISYDKEHQVATWYLNGAAEGKRTITALSSLSSPMPTSFGMNFGGSIAEVRYLNVARNEREIYANKNNLLDASFDGLVGYWDFEEPGSKVLHNVISSVIGTGNLHGTYEWKSEIMEIDVPLKDGELQPTRTENQYYKTSLNQLAAYVPTIVADTAYQMIVTGQKTQVNFENITGYTLSGSITGRCGFQVGKSTVRIQSLNGCFEFSQDTVGSYFEFENLPPLKYKVDVIPSEHPSIQFDPQIVDLVENKHLEYIYQAPIQVEIIREGLGEPITCNDGVEQDQWIHVMKQSLSAGEHQYPVKIRVYEEYFGQKCYVEDATIQVVDNIGEGTKTSELRYTSSPSKIYTDEDYPVAVYTTEPGTPNIAEGGDHSFQKSLTVTVTDNAGRQTQDEVWVFVEGREQLEKTFTTSIEDLPLYVLRDPPGDASYSYISRGESICRSYDLNLSQAFGYGNEWSFDGGPDLFIGLLGKIIFIQAKAEVTIGLDVSVSGGINNNLEVCVTFNEAISTSDEPYLVGEAADLFMGLGLNYIFGHVRELRYDYDNCEILPPIKAISGKIDNVSTFYAYTREHVQTKVIPNLEELISKDSVDLRKMAKDDPKRAKLESEIIKLKQGRINWKTRLLDSQYRDESYQDDINKFYVELNADKDFWEVSDVSSTVSKFLKSALKTVGEVLDQDSFEGQSERFKEERKNISFGYGSNYEFSLESSYSQSHSSLYSLEVEASEDITAGIKIEGVGPVTDFSLSQTTTIEYAKTNATGKNTVTGFFLSDKDPGDFFSVDVSKDYKTGIFQFKTLAGESMCPHEPSTRQREKISLSTGQMDMINLDPDKTGQAIFYASNVSETDDGSDWRMALIAESNPKGAKITVNGVDISQPVMLKNVDPGTSVPLLVQIERNPQYYTYEDIQIAIYSTCEFDAPSFSEGTYQTLSINAVFGSPCVNDFQYLQVQGNNKVSENSRWVINTRDEQMVTNPITGKTEPQVSMNIVYSTYDWAGDLANTGVDYFILEYAEANSENWIPVRETKQDRFDLVKENKAFSAINWNATDLPDGQYKIRLVGLCTNGTRTASFPLYGDIARTPPGVFATYPEDGQLSKGDRLGIKFDRQINCNIRPFNWKIVGIYNGVRYQPKSLRFDGVNDYLVISKEDTLMQSFLQGDSDLTIEFWMKSGAKRRSTIISNRIMSNGTPGFGISVEMDNAGRLEFNMVDSLLTHQLKLTSSFVIADGKWHYVAIRVDRNNANKALQQAQFYIDMKPDHKVGISSNKWSSLQTGSPFLVGKHHLSNSPAYDGYMDEIRFWSIARDVSNNTTKNGLLQTWRSHILGSSGMAAYIKLDEGTGDALNDLMNADNRGELVNGVSWSNDVPEWDYKNLSYPEYVDATVACNGDEILLYLPEDVNTLKALENVMLTASTIAVKDLFGNRSNLAEWQFMVNKNSISWEYPNVDGITQIGESINVKMKLFNKGVEEERFNITNLPEWLTANPADGNILPGGFVEVTFSTVDWLGLGDYSTEIFAENNEGWEPLVVNIRALCETPQYSFDPSKYESSMNLSVPILVGNRISTDPEDKVFAFIGGELRGEGTVQFLGGEDTYRALMTIYGDISDKDESMTFNIWDASECREYTGIKQAFTFTADTVIVVHVTEDELIEIEGYADADASGSGSSSGSVVSEVLNLNPAGDMTRHIELKKGWNWVSSNFESSGQLINAVNGDLTIDDKIVQGAQSANFNKSEWVGTMTGLNPLRAFRIYAQNDATITIRGEMVSARSSIALDKGWNWLSYIPEFPMPINQALESLKLVARNDDVIKSQDEFAYFIEGTGWVGNLQTMKPGEGYQIRLSNPSTFSYQANAKPVVDLGSNKEVYLPENAITLSSIASDADGDAISFEWTKLKGGNAELIDDQTANLNLRSLNEGEYVLVLKVTDTNGAFAQDTIVVNVISNQAPVVSLEDNFFAVLPRESFEIEASATDPDGKVASFVWEKVSGPEVTLSNKNTNALNLTRLKKGNYEFKVHVTDDRNGVTSASTHLEVVEINEGNIAVNKRIKLTNAAFGNPTDEQAILDDSTKSVGKIYGNGQEIQIEIDLFSDYRITRMLIDWNTRLYATDYDISVAQDNVDGNKNYVKYNEVAGGDGQTDDLVKIISARYVKIRVKGTNAKDSLGINEIKLYGVALASSNSPSLAYDTACVGSSSVVGSNGVKNLYDNSIYTYFETAESPFNIDIDFGKIMESRRMWVELTSTSEQGQFFIYTSLDSINWVKIWGDAAAGEGFINPRTAKKVEINRRAFGRYYRLVGQADGVALGNFKVADFKVFGVEADPRNMALNKTVTAGSKDAEHGTFALVDGYYNEGWISDKSGVQDIIIDLGEPKDIERLVMDWASLAYATSFEVYAGHNLYSDYQKIYTSGHVTDSRQDITLDGLGRYLKIKLLSIYGGAIPQMKEMEIYGQPASRNIAPIISTQNIVSYNTQDTLRLTAFDPLGNIVRYQWTQLSGKTNVQLSQSDTDELVVSNLEPGVYSFKVTVVDDSSAAVSANALITVLNYPDNLIKNRSYTPGYGTWVNLGNAIDGDEATAAVAEGEAGYASFEVATEDFSAIERIRIVWGSNVKSDTYIYLFSISEDAGNRDSRLILQTWISANTVSDFILDATQASTARGTSRFGFFAFDPVMIKEIEAYGRKEFAPALTMEKTDTVRLALATNTTITPVIVDELSAQSYLWQKLSGDNGATFNPSVKDLHVSNLKPGNYAFKFTVKNKGYKSATDTVRIYATDNRPVVNAGQDLLANDVSNTVVIDAHAQTELGGLIYTWTQESGPACTLINADGEDLTVSGFPEPTNFIFRLTVENEDGVTQFDEVQITVLKLLSEDHFTGKKFPLFEEFSKLTDGDTTTILDYKGYRSYSNNNGSSESLTPIRVYLPKRDKIHHIEIQLGDHNLFYEKFQVSVKNNQTNTSVLNWSEYGFKLKTNQTISLNVNNQIADFVEVSLSAISNSRHIEIKEIKIYGMPYDETQAVVDITREGNVTVTASSTQTGYSVANLTDGNYTTEWRPETSQSENEITIDLGDDYFIESIEVDYVDKELNGEIRYSKTANGYFSYTPTTQYFYGYYPVDKMYNRNRSYLNGQSIRYLKLTRLNDYSENVAITEIKIYGKPATTSRIASLYVEAEESAPPVSSWVYTPADYDQAEHFVIEVAGVSRKENVFVGSFSNDAASGFVKSINYGEKKLFFVNALGKTEENIRYEFYSAEEDGLYHIQEEFAFEAGGRKGTIENPLVVHLAQRVGTEPLFNPVEDQMTTEGKTFENLNLSEYFEDTDFMNINLNVYNVSDLKVEAEGTLLKVHPRHAHWFGTDSILVTASFTGKESYELSRYIQYTVQNVDDKPELEQLPVIKVEPGKAFELSLKDYLIEWDGDPVKYEVSRSEYFEVKVVGDVLKITAKDVSKDKAEQVKLLVADNTPAGKYSFQEVKIEYSAQTVLSVETPETGVGSFPNPFITSTQISYQVSQQARVQLRIYNTSGQLVKTLADADQSPGQYSLLWDGTTQDGKVVSAGLYFCMLRMGEEIYKIKILKK